MSMTRDDWESRQYIDRLTDSWHRCSGRYPSKNEVIRLLRIEKKWHLKPADKTMKANSFKFRCYSRFVVDELVRLIRSSEEEDPIRIIYQFMDFMDDMVTYSDNKTTWVFAGVMRDAARDILDLI